MRIGIAIESFDPGRGGAERSTCQIARELARRGHLVRIVAGAAPSGLDGRDGIEVVRWRGDRKPRSSLDAVRFCAWARRQLVEADLDETISVTSVVPAGLVQPRAGIMRESFARGLLASPPPRRLLRRVGLALSVRRRTLLRLEAATFRDTRVRLFVAISRSMERQMLRHYAVPPSRVTLVANGADVERVAPGDRARRRADARARLGWAEGVPVVLFASRDARRKGLRPLLSAFRSLRSTTPAVRLAVAGEWPAWAAGVASRLGVADGVERLGVVDAMGELYCAADLVTLPSYYDPASRVVIEALMAGTPVVASRHDGSSDWIDACGEERAGIVIDEPDDVETLAAAMRRLLETPGPTTPGRPAPAAAPIDPYRLSMRRHVDELEKLLATA